MIDSLPPPDFSNVLEEALITEVLKEIHLTIYLENYYRRLSRVQEIITAWDVRSTQIAKEREELWNM